MNLKHQITRRWHHLRAALAPGLQTAPRRTPAASPFGPAGQTGNGWIAPQAQVRWLGPGVSFYTPQMVEQLLRQALAGDLQSQWEMFDMMEITDPKIGANLNRLKEAILEQPLTVRRARMGTAEPTEEAERRAALIEHAFDAMVKTPTRDENDFRDTCYDLLDARGKGLSVLEVKWDAASLPDGTSAWLPTTTRWVHPAWYGYAYGPGDANLKLKIGAVPATGQRPTGLPPSVGPGQNTAWPSSPTSSGPRNFVDFPEHRFLIGLCKAKTGHPLGSAMLHCLTFWWAAKNFTAEWFLNFCQVYGQPIRWANYTPEMTPADLAKLTSALQAMGNSAYAAFPEGTTFELKEAKAQGRDTANQALIELADKYIDLVILGQTLTSDVSQAGGSRALGETHEHTLGGIEGALVQWLGNTLQPLVDSICLANYGDLNERPRLAPPADDDEDPATLATTLQTLANAGLEPTDEALPDLGERLNIPIQRKVPVAPPNMGDPNSGGPGMDKQGGEGEPPKGGTPSLAARSSGSAPLIRDPHLTDAIADPRAAALAAAFKGRYAPIRRIILESESAEDAQAKLAKFYPELSENRVTALVEEAMQISAAAGAVEAKSQ
jgi:phage gp29-like protein